MRRVSRGRRGRPHEQRHRCARRSAKALLHDGLLACFDHPVHGDPQQLGNDAGSAGRVVLLLRAIDPALVVVGGD